MWEMRDRVMMHNVRPQELVREGHMEPRSRSSSWSAWRRLAPLSPRLESRYSLQFQVPTFLVSSVITVTRYVINHPRWPWCWPHSTLHCGEVKKEMGYYFGSFFYPTTAQPKGTIICMIAFTSDSSSSWEHIQLYKWDNNIKVDLLLTVSLALYGQVNFDCVWHKAK